MAIKVKGAKLTLSSGRELDPNCGFVGLNLHGEVSLGFDDVLYTPDGWSDDPLTDEEKHEIAEHMIRLWGSFGRVKTVQPISPLEADGLPTLYLGPDGMVCTHRMADADIPVWCRPDEAQALLKVLTYRNVEGE